MSSILFLIFRKIVFKRWSRRHIAGIDFVRK